MEVHRRRLSFAYHHDLFAVGFAVVRGIPVAQREERQPLACEVALAEVGYVPSQGVVADFAAGIAAVRPHGGGPGRPFGQCEAVFGEEVQRFPHVSVYFGAFHSSV